jgi:hypothetical protein
MKRACAAGIFVLLVFPTWAAADPILLWSFRGANAYANVNEASQGHLSDAPDSNAITVRATDSGPQGSASASGFLSSSTDPSNLWGSGASAAAVSATSWTQADVNAFYDVGLRLDQPYDFTFHAEFTGDSTPFNPDQPNQTAYWTAMLRSDPTASLFFRDTGYQGTTLDRTGRLSAGEWELYLSDYAEAFARFGGTASAESQYRFTLTLTPANGPAPAPTPEPASMLLLGTGIAGAAAARRKRRAGSR